MPEELQGTSGGVEQASGAATSGSTGDVSTTATSAGGTSGAGGGSSLGATPPVSPVSGAQTDPLGTQPAATGAGTAQQQQSLRDLAKRLGYAQAEQHGDDHTFFSQLLLQAQQTSQLQAQLQQAQQYARAGQEYLQHRSEFQRFQEEQRRRAQPEEKPWFKAPEYDPGWRAKLTRDPQTGEIRAIPGAPPDLVGKYLSAVEHRENFLDKFAFDPVGAIKPGIEEVVRSIAADLVKQQLGQYQATQAATQIIKQNESWLYAKDGQGQVRYAATGQPELSPAGRAYYGYAEQAAQRGIQDDQGIHEYALGLLQRDMALMQLQRLQGGQATPPTQPIAVPQQTSPQETGEAAKQGFLSRAVAGQQHQPQHAGSTNGKGAQNGALSLEERLRQNFKANGVTDESIRESLSGGGRRR